VDPIGARGGANGRAGGEVRRNGFQSFQSQKYAAGGGGGARRGGEAEAEGMSDDFVRLTFF
jgi:hypothetical protein